ncbi:MotA/TolQ/ExbB proton channel family protein [Roseibium salinum]|nr:MotA/TolQ/ExbB proton channel family protein [Roseibium salinum]
MPFLELLQPVTGLLELGGPVVALIAVLSIVALAVTLLKLYQFARERVGRTGSAERAVALWKSGRRQDAVHFLAHPVSAAEEAAVTAMHLSREEIARNEIEDEVQRIATLRLHRLQSGFRLLDAVSQVAPLLGLFGTVLGMITAFQELQNAGNAVDPSALAGGIWVALLTTAAGLGVAMPVSLVLTFFSRPGRKTSGLRSRH